MRVALPLTLLFLLAGSCAQDISPSSSPNNSQIIRVLLAEQTDRIAVQAANPTVSVSGIAPRVLQFPPNTDVPIWMTGGAWHIGAIALPAGTLTLRPDASRPIRVDGVSYRGNLRLVPLGSGRFDAVNDVDLDDYLRGVVTKEMPASWPMEALKSQAVVARTYALYEAHTTGIGRNFDVYTDTRSQVYGGLSGETAAARQAVDETTGMVLTYEGKIFKTYFSSCCGGVTASAADAFGDPFIPPLAAQNHLDCCVASPYFNWGPITIGKDEITRRIHAWAARREPLAGHRIPESDMATVTRITVDSVNAFGRPTRVLITDARGLQYSWPAEQLREAINTDVSSGGTSRSTLPSSYCKISSDSVPGAIMFYDGHGYGHGVGMCQWCARSQAGQGMACAQILADAYPQSHLERAY